MDNLYFISKYYEIKEIPSRYTLGKIDLAVLYGKDIPWAELADISRGKASLKRMFKHLKRVNKRQFDVVERFKQDCGTILLPSCIQVFPKNLKFSPKKVIFNNPATIVLWDDGDKTVVKCNDGDRFDPEKGYMFCYLKKIFGREYYKTIVDLCHHENLTFQFVKKVIFRDPMTIVIWDDGTKTYAKCNEGYYDTEKAVAVCILKRIFGGSFYLKNVVPTLQEAYVALCKTTLIKMDTLSSIIHRPFTLKDLGL